MQVGMAYPAMSAVRPDFLSPQISFPPEWRRRGPATPAQPEATAGTSGKEEANPYHQWPLRTMAFASDLGTVGHLVNLPKLFWAGWLVAAPYYVCSVASRPDREKKEEELIYQATANGFFPLLSAKLGVSLGRLAEGHFGGGQHSKTGETRPSPLWRMGGGLGALAVLTPTLCDPLSRWLLEKWRSNHPGSAES